LLRQASRILNRAAQVQPLFPHPDATATESGGPL
jgi:hypothetical protein